MIMQTDQWRYYTDEHTIGFTPQLGDEWANDYDRHPMPDNPAILWHTFGEGEVMDATTLNVTGYIYRRPTGNVAPTPTESNHFI
jgi:hypothetical protein